jgi:hypothetical protein
VGKKEIEGEEGEGGKEKERLFFSFLYRFLGLSPYGELLLLLVLLEYLSPSFFYPYKEILPY